MKEGKPVQVEAGQELRILTDPTVGGDASEISTTCLNLHEVAKEGDLIYINRKIISEITKVE